MISVILQVPWVTWCEKVTCTTLSIREKACGGWFTDIAVTGATDGLIFRVRRYRASPGDPHRRGCILLTVKNI